MRLIDADALKEYIDMQNGRPFIGCTVGEALKMMTDEQPTIEPERKKDVIQKFHDYQIEWLTSHCDIELEPVLESWIVRFLHDTANCYMMEVEHDT